MPIYLPRLLLETCTLIGAALVVSSTVRRVRTAGRPPQRELPHILDDIGLIPRVRRF